MATNTPTTGRPAPSTAQAVAVILAPVWVILATVLYGLWTGEVSL
jgi:hypothetical protein